MNENDTNTPVISSVSSISQLESSNGLSSDTLFVISEKDETGYVSKKINTDILINGISSSIRLDKVNQNISDISSDLTTLISTQLSDILTAKDQWVCCDIESPYVISSIYTHQGLISTLNGYRLSTAMDNAFKNTVFDRMKVSSLTSDQIHSDKVYIQNNVEIQDFVNSSIEHMAAFYVTKDISGNPFETFEELNIATNTLSSNLSDDWMTYIGGRKAYPKQNDYCIVLSDETAQQKYGPSSVYTTRYSWNETKHHLDSENISGDWEFRYIVNNSPYTQSQWDAINSGITKEWMDTHESVNLSTEDWEFVLEDGETVVTKTIYVKQSSSDVI